MKKPKEFDVINVELNGSNLIEASAGTGKTFSIAILVLRLVLEKRISVKEILMVTYTKAAVAELEERVRLFVRLAYRFVSGEKINNAVIEKMILDYPDKANVKKTLDEAVLFLDETSVLTIHGFCQKTLTEFAFETNQLFGAEALQDVNAVVTDEVNKFWRNYITSVPVKVLQTIKSHGLSRVAIGAIVNEHMKGKKYFAYTNDKDYTLTPSVFSQFDFLIDEYENTKAILSEQLVKYVIENKEKLNQAALQDTYTQKNACHLLDEPEMFIDYIIKTKSIKVKTVFSDVVNLLSENNQEQIENQNKLHDISDAIICAAIQSILKGVESYKSKMNQLSFDDLIVKVHKAFYSDRAIQLSNVLQKKYKAVFIDEFQDTDRLQYEIFNRAFGRSSTIVFYIGDPKQSIYAWRKADIFTYFKAYKDVDNLYGMNENFRSTSRLIEAMNYFFKPRSDFDSFHFNNQEPSIDYIEVKSPKGLYKGEIYKEGIADFPITITKAPNKNEILEALGAQVVALLKPDSVYELEYENEKHTVRPSDIGILVRTNNDGREIKELLANLGIPSVTISDEKVLQSSEATALIYLLQAMYDISRKHINRALLSVFTGFSINEILKIKDEDVLDLFKKYKTRWDTAGIYATLMDFIIDFNVEQKLLERHTENGERILTNLYHLVELLHKQQASKKLTPPELIGWLKRSIEGMESEGDEYVQRIENDDESVKIVTIHSSKGLEYKIVFAPFMDLLTSLKHEVSSFRDPVSSDYISMKTKRMKEAQILLYQEQQEQENRRIIYVAITRAVYKCFIYKNTNSKGSSNFSNSSLAFFTNELHENANPLIEVNNNPVLLSSSFKRFNYASITAPAKKTNVNFSLLQENWKKMSYSYLSAKPDPIKKTSSNKSNHPYDHFVFHQLLKGEQTGNLLHSILEKINFTETSGHAESISNSIRQYAPSQNELYTEYLPKMIDEILHTEIITQGDESFQLSAVEYSKRIHEFEFDFPVMLFNPEALEHISDNEFSVYVKDIKQIEGIMNGKVDMFFEYNNKYYILDWKSNYLGDKIEDYQNHMLSDAMSENNYHLQYLIYTVAVKKYLESKLDHFDYNKDFGGVIYLFLRGIRKNRTNGIFFKKPSYALIEKLSGIFTGNVISFQ
ncbi:MAG: exodeoxyribonuclease V subunit beta [Ferruginibacter sp.]|nr:exodeoxyribonuclease V subunit beta [Ferruginibacter sp.]